MDKLASQVARKIAAMFNVGDIVLYGKYKNKKGKILSFGKNDKGQPTIVIEPIPKGRKKNKEMGLYKIWSLPKEDKKASMDDDLYRSFYAQETPLPSIDLHTEFPLTALKLSERVATRHVKAFGIPLGKTWDSGDVRIQRYSDSFKIWDLTNAGKRGKKVKWMSVSPSYSYKGDRGGWMEQMSKALPDYESYGKVKAFFQDILHDYPGEINIDEGESRGIDVNPGGTTEIRLKTNTGIEITSEPMSFLVKTHVPLSHHTTGEPIGFQDTLYWNRKKEGAAVFYNWLKANMAEANKMTILDLTKLWDSMGVLWDSH